MNKNKIKARELNWEVIKPESFESRSENAPISVLKINDGPAYYQVNIVNSVIEAQLWVGNRAFSVAGHHNRYTKIQEAKDDCQRHFNSLIRENIK
jgi:hypothetical protein